MTYIVNRNWTYYICGNYHSTTNGDMQFTPVRYCASEQSIDDPGTTNHFPFTTTVR